MLRLLPLRCENLECYFFNPCCFPPTSSIIHTMKSPITAIRFDPVPRSNSNMVSWHAPNTPIHVTLTMLTPVVGPTIPLLLMDAYGAILDRAMQHGENALIPQGTFSWEGPNRNFFRAWNTNVNHAMNWRVLQFALGVVWNYLLLSGYGTLRFTIYDGGNEVGQGTIGA